MVNRAVILGASNVSLGYPTISRLLMESSDQPLEIFTACGHGRSYGKWSQFLYRRLPGIVQSHLWEQLKIQQKKQEASSFTALITDVGNDLVYSITVPQILEWLRICLDQLKEYQAEITVTELPVESIMRLSKIRYEMTRRLFFGGKSLDWDEMKARILALNESLVQLQKEYQFKLVKPEFKWYGFDPIHVKRSKRVESWKEILDWNGIVDIKSDLNNNYSASADLPSFRSLNRGNRHERMIFGKIKRTQQPAIESGLLSIYGF